MLSRLGIKSKLLLMLLVVSITSIGVVSVVSFLRSRDALTERVTESLTSERETLGSRIESYFQTIDGQAATLAEDRMVLEAAAEFSVGWDQLEDLDAEAANDQTASQELETTYENFLAALPQPDGDDTVDRYRPKPDNARYLQHQYIVAGDVEDRSDIDDVDDGTFYNRVHRRYHPALRNYVNEFGFYDLFLIDAPTGDILYSVEKELDYATNLIDGPYRNSNLGRLYRAVAENPSPGRVAFVDYDFYRPSLDAPAAFVASPIINPDTNEFEAVLALQLPVDEINEVMTAGGEWEANGFGATGEAYLVGADLTMRSQARPLLEAPEDYLAQVRQRGDLDPGSVDRIDLYKSTVLLQPVNTAAARSALGGETDTGVVRDYRGNETLTSYSPLDISGLQWAVVSQVDLDEANSPVSDLQRDLLVATGLIVLVLTGLAMVLSSMFVRPIYRLIEWAEKVRAGDLAAASNVTSKDEFGELAESFNELVTAMADQRRQLVEQNEDNEALLLSVMPRPIAERLKAGEERIADEYPNVSVIHGRITGFARFTRGADAGAAADVLNDLTAGLDEVAERHGIEKIKTVGNRYIAACGLTQPRLDHRRRAVEFAAELRTLATRYAAENNFDLGVAVGISTGSVEAGVIGRTRPAFELWGEVAENAERLCDEAGDGDVITTLALGENLDDLFTFGEVATLAGADDRGHETALRYRAYLGPAVVSDPASHVHAVEPSPADLPEAGVAAGESGGTEEPLATSATRAAEQGD